MKKLLLISMLIFLIFSIQNIIAKQDTAINKKEYNQSFDFLFGYQLTNKNYDHDILRVLGAKLSYNHYFSSKSAINFSVGACSFWSSSSYYIYDIPVLIGISSQFNTGIIKPYF